MHPAYQMLKTTDRLAQAVKMESISDTRQVLIEIQDDMRDRSISSDVYDEILEDIDILIEDLQVYKNSPIEGFSDSFTAEINLVATRIDSLYLRHANTRAETDTDSVEQVKRERDLYREKLLRYQTPFLTLEAESEELSEKSEAMATQLARISNTAAEFDPDQYSDGLDSLDNARSSLEEANQHYDEKMTEIRNKLELDEQDDE